MNYLECFLPSLLSAYGSVQIPLKISQSVELHKLYNLKLDYFSYSSMAKGVDGSMSRLWLVDLETLGWWDRTRLCPKISRDIDLV